MIAMVACRRGAAQVRREIPGRGDRGCVNFAGRGGARVGDRRPRLSGRTEVGGKQCLDLNFWRRRQVWAPGFKAATDPNGSDRAICRAALGSTDEGVCRYTNQPGTKVGSRRNGWWSCNLDGMSAGEFRLPVGWARPRGSSLPLSARFIKLAELRRLRGTEQVAAVCYRVRNSGIEFLLVQTRGGHWTFPKGKVEAGITQAQAAALEAFEEAGVHGRMEELSFTQYVRRKGGESGKANGHARSNPIGNALEIVINAYLCEVARLTPPQESGRTPTWCSVEKAKRRLREDRNSEFGDELVRVVEEAVARIQRTHGRSTSTALVRRARFGIIEGKRR
jgi:8-oxo-dGTP pyrophosphatase MutT (NUDIX family)